MEVLVLDGKNYVKASKAARDLGYAADYVSQLCRSNQVDAHLIGRTWYVNQEQLSTHRTDKKRTSRLKAREHAKKTIEEHRLKIQEKQNNYTNIDIRYENDNADLIPKTRKVAIETEKENESIYGKESNISEDTIVLNKGNKVILSGDVAVVDVTDEVTDPDTIFLTPSKILKSSTQIKKIPQQSRALEVTTDDSPLKERATFREKLEEVVTQEDEILVAPSSTGSYAEVTRTATSNNAKQSIVPYLILLLLLLVAVLCTVPFSYTISYVDDNSEQTTEGVAFSLEKTVEIIKEKYRYLGKTI